MTTQIEVTGSLQVELPPEEAFELFTPRGEEAWVPGWAPRFPAAAPDDSAPGTVFVTSSGGQVTTWITVRRTRSRHLRYARVVSDRHAGTVDVRIEPRKAGSEVTVSYHLTALSESAGPDLERFADGFAAYLRGWEKAIRASIAPRPGSAKTGP